MTALAAVLSLLSWQGPVQGQFSQLAAQADAARAAGAPNAPSLYQQALKLKPDWKDGWWSLGTLHYKANQSKECAEDFERLVALDPGSAPAHAMLGLCQFQLQRYDAALEHLQKSQSLNLTNEAIAMPAEYTLAKLWTKRGNFEAALTILFDFAQMHKDNPAYLLLSGAAGLWRPLFPEEIPQSDRELLFLAGRAFWEGAQRNLPVARASFDDLLSRYPTAAGVHYLYGSFELYDQPDKALGLFLEEHRLNPKHIGVLTALAAEYLRRGDSAKAMAYARDSVELAPQSYAAHALLGRALLDSGDLEASKKELEQARQLAPEEAQPHIALASLYTKLGRSEDAARERREFLRIQAKNKKPNEK